MEKLIKDLRKKGYDARQDGDKVEVIFKYAVGGPRFVGIESNEGLTVETCITQIRGAMCYWSMAGGDQDAYAKLKEEIKGE